MEWTNGGHFNDFSCQEFNPVIFREDTDFAHAVVFVHSETMGLQHNGHGLPPIKRLIRLLRGQDEIHTESCLSLLWINLGDQRPVPWCSNTYMDVGWPTRIASWKVGG